MIVDWQAIFETFVATTAGALVAITTILIQRRFDERKALAEWFESSYIEQSIDLVMGYAASLEINRYLQIQKRSSVPFQREMPIDALSRLETIVGDKTYTLWLFYFTETAPELVNGVQDPEARQQLLSIESQMIGKVHESLRKVRQDLLDTKIERKRHIYGLREHAVIQSQVSDMAENLKRFSEQL